MAILNQIAKQARITAYKDKVEQKLASKVIDVDKLEFLDLVSDKGVPMRSLNGEIILERHIGEDGKLKGVVSVSPDSLATILPELKNDTEDKAGWKKYFDQWKAEGLPDILKDVADPTPDEYELTAMEELATLDIDAMSDYDAKQKLRDIEARITQENR